MTPVGLEFAILRLNPWNGGNAYDFVIEGESYRSRPKPRLEKERRTT